MLGVSSGWFGVGDVSVQLFYHVEKEVVNSTLYYQVALTKSLTMAWDTLSLERKRRGGFQNEKRPAFADVNTP